MRCWKRRSSPARERAEIGRDGQDVTSAIEDFFSVPDALEAKFGAPGERSAGIGPTTSVALDEEKASSR